MTFVRQSTIIFLAFSLTLLLNSIITNATVPILGIMILFYAVLPKRKKTENINLFVLVSFVFILVTSTGGIYSPVFFLLYLLSASIAFLFEPKIVFILVLGLIGVLFPQALKEDINKNLILLFSFIPLSPLAFFASLAYKERQKLKLKSQNLKSKIKTRSKTFFLLLVTCYLSLVTVPIANGQTMSNQDYIIKMQGFNAFSGITEGQDYKLKSTVGELSPVTSEGVNFKVKAGFENIASTLPFSITLSSNIVDFGNLSATNPVIRTVDLKTNSLPVYGYSVIVSENESLTTIPPASKTFIPDTTCDNGECGVENASEWTNTLTYGFGYRCDNMVGVDCDSSFVKNNFYKHFPNLTSSDDPQSIMSGIGANNKEARISYKVNISGTQAQGTYSNVVTYVAIPNF